MRKIGLFAAGTALILFGLVMWTTSTTHALVATSRDQPTSNDGGRGGSAYVSLR